MPTVRPVSASTAPDPARAAVALTVQRRVAGRRAADRAAARETALIADVLGALRSAGTADERLVRVLRLTADAAGAVGAAVRVRTGTREVTAAWGRGTATREGMTADVCAAQEGGASGETLLPAGDDRDDRYRLAAWLAEAPHPTRASPASLPRARTTGRAQPVPSDEPAREIVLLADDDTGRSAGDMGRRAEGDAPPTYVLLHVPDDPDAAMALAVPGPAPVDAAAALPASLLGHVSLAASLWLEDRQRRAEMDRIMARDDERSHLLGTVAHELRTPLASIAGYLDLLLDDRVDEPAVRTEFLQRSRGVVRSMSELIGDLLDLARVRAGVLPLHITSFSAADAARSVCDALVPQALARDITLDAALGPRLRAAVADRRRTEQVLLNLVGNAVKFGGRGGHVRLEVDGGPGSVVFIVSDDGPGIDPADHERIFERFERAGSSHDQGRVPGTGLGLAIVRELVRGMDGDVGVASARGTGATFVVALPGTNSTPDRVRASFDRALAAARHRFASGGPHAGPDEARATGAAEAIARAG